MFSDIATFRTELSDRLESTLPAAWEIVKEITAPNVALVPAVYIEYKELDTVTAKGEELPRGTVAASVDLVLVDPRTADGVAEDAIDHLIVPLLRELDKHDDIAWSKAVKVRLDAGPFAWRISLTTLVTL